MIFGGGHPDDPCVGYVLRHGYRYSCGAARKDHPIETYATLSYRTHVHEFFEPANRVKALLTLAREFKEDVITQVPGVSVALSKRARGEADLVFAFVKPIAISDYAFDGPMTSTTRHERVQIFARHEEWHVHTDCMIDVYVYE